MRLERFSEAAQEVFQAAQEIMQQQGHTHLDAEHIFLAMLRQPQGDTSRILEHLYVDPIAVIGSVERELEKAPKVYGQHNYGNQVYVTPRTQRFVKRAEALADRRNEFPITITDLLISISSEQEGASARILRSFGVEHERLLAAIGSLPEPPTLEERITALEQELAALRQPAPQSGAAESTAALQQAQQQIAELERQNKLLRDLLRQVRDQLRQAYEGLSEA